MCLKLKDSRIDQKTYEIKKKKIDQFKRKIETSSKNIKEYNEAIKDIKSELKCAEILLKNDGISNLKFSETPDIIIKLNMKIQYGVEVKRIQVKPEDFKDDKRLEDKFTRYGEPRTDSHDKEIPWSKYVTDLILEKMNKKYTTEKTILFIDSHSYHQIESQVIEEGILNAIIIRSGKIPFEAIMYKTQFVPIDNINKTIIIFLNHMLEHSSFFNSIKKTNNFVIKYFFNNQITNINL